MYFAFFRSGADSARYVQKHVRDADCWHPGPAAPQYRPPTGILQLQVLQEEEEQQIPGTGACQTNPKILTETTVDSQKFV